MDARWPVSTTGEGTRFFRFFLHAELTFIPRVRQGWGRSTPTCGTMRIWDTQTGVVIRDIAVDDSGDIAFSSIQRAILPSYDYQLGACWVHDESLRFAKSFRARGQLIISICEFQPASNPSLLVVGSFHAPPHDGEFSFSPVSSHASFVTETEVVILDVRETKTLFRTKEAHPHYAPPGYFSPDGRFFACGTFENEIRVWENAPVGYVPWSIFSPRLPPAGFAFSPLGTSALSWGPEGIELLYPDNPSGGTHIATPRREDIVVSRRAMLDPGQTCPHF